MLSFSSSSELLWKIAENLFDRWMTNCAKASCQIGRIIMIFHLAISFWGHHITTPMIIRRIRGRREVTLFSRSLLFNLLAKNLQKTAHYENEQVDSMNISTYRADGIWLEDDRVFVFKSCSAWQIFTEGHIKKTKKVRNVNKNLYCYINKIASPPIMPPPSIPDEWV